MNYEKEQMQDKKDKTNWKQITLRESPGGAMHTGISRCMNIVSVTFPLLL